MKDACNHWVTGISACQFTMKRRELEDSWRCGIPLSKTKHKKTAWNICPGILTVNEPNKNHRAAGGIGIYIIDQDVNLNISKTFSGGYLYGSLFGHFIMYPCGCFGCYFVPVHIFNPLGL